MRTAPGLDEAALIDAIQVAYGLDGIMLSYSPGGEDAHSYRVTDGDGQHFQLKLYIRSLDWDAVLGIPRQLNRMGFHHAVAALRTQDDALKFTFDDYTAALYPFVDGPTASQKPFNADQLAELGRILGHLHEMTDLIEMDCPREEFNTSEWRVNFTHTVSALTHAEHSDDPYQQKLAAMLIPLRERLLLMLSEFQLMAEQCQALEVPYALCHGDPSIGNVIAARDEVYLIDWDGVILAPKERDLMHFGADDQPDKQPLFDGYAEVTGEAPTRDETILKYYRMEWNVQEVIDFSRRILFEPDADAEQKDHDLREMDIFLNYSGLRS